MEFEADLTWEKIRDDVFAVNIELAKILDEIDPPSKATFIKAKYQYGEMFCQNGEFCFSPNTSSEIIESLQYAGFPLGIVTKKIFEVFVPYKQRVLPETILSPGRIFGAFEVAGKLTDTYIAHIWNGQAGSRLAFALPRITDQIGLDRIRKHYEIPHFVTCNTLFDHFHLFKDIAGSPKCQQEWTGELILFSKAWFENKQAKYLKMFKDFVIELAFKQASNYLNFTQANVIAQQFIESYNEELRNRRIPTYLNETVKQLIAILLGERPGIEICSETDGDEFLPLQEVQQALLFVYGLEKKKYQPTLMRTAKSLDATSQADPNKTVYYSLSLPLLLNEEILQRNTTIMQDIKQVKMLSEAYLTNLPLIKFEKKYSHMDYFHIEADSEGMIKSSTLIPELDPTALSKRCPDLNFCATSLFWRGAISFTNRDF